MQQITYIPIDISGRIQPPDLIAGIAKFHGALFGIKKQSQRSVVVSQFEVDPS